MSLTTTIAALHSFCENNSGDFQIWEGNNGTYHWNFGKVTADGITNGVVRKLAGIDVSGKKIWVVAGSLKIDAVGVITRFTGMSKAQQKIISSVSETVEITPEELNAQHTESITV